MIYEVEKKTPADKDWPQGLMDLGKRAPKQLWYQGKWDPKLFEKCAAVVGSRRITEYGRRIVEKIVPKLVDDGWTIVSGMMYGTDQAAHRAAMSYGGHTIGIVGWGIDYPGVASEDILLMNKITESGGLILSEWEKQAGTLWTFPQRDRIMAAISQEIFVIEAAEKSGALITADWGIKLDRKIRAVPGPITSRVSEGTNKLIAEGKAEMWMPDGKKGIERLGNNENKSILRLLQNEALTTDEIARKLDLGVEEIGAKLSIMLVSGEIKEREGKYFKD